MRHLIWRFWLWLWSSSLATSNSGALIIRIGFWGGSDIRLRRTKLEMTCASIECVAAYEQQLRECGQGFVAHYAIVMIRNPQNRIGNCYGSYSSYTISVSRRSFRLYRHLLTACGSLRCIQHDPPFLLCRDGLQLSNPSDVDKILKGLRPTAVGPSNSQPSESFNVVQNPRHLNAPKP